MDSNCEEWQAIFAASAFDSNLKLA